MAKKILIVEDEQFLAEMYQMKFESEGYDITVASDGEECLKKTKTENFDLILLDLVMPGMDGFQVLEKLRSNEKTMKVKIYILSNLGQEEEVAEAFDKGADGFLIKANLTPAELMEDVKKIFAGETVGEVKRGS